ncbi:MAG TPA: hypothetical protein PLZ31_03890 [Myxococcota bacterium]|nr:hypothetical protein [Myxococcota bacterium]HPB50356.1 hypothetical protein [Myxococcota bacterium]
MKKAILMILGLSMLLFVACETGLPRWSPTEGTLGQEYSGSNRLSFMGGGNITYEAPDGGFVVPTDVLEEVEEDASY